MKKEYIVCSLPLPFPSDFPLPSHALFSKLITSQRQPALFSYMEKKKINNKTVTNDY